MIQNLNALDYIRDQKQRHQGASCFPVMLNHDEAEIIIEALIEYTRDSDNLRSEK